MSGIIYYKRPEILDRIPKNRHTVIEASAGTGKTYTIEHLFVELLMTQNITIDSILVLTYTERAAGELRSRIRTMIEKVLSTEPMLEKPSEICWEIDAEKRIHLERALFSFDMAPIHTIHSFFQRVVSEHAFNSGHLFEQSIIDSKSAFQDAFLIALRKELSCSDAYAPYLHTWLASGKSLDDLRDNLYVCHSLNRLILPHFDETVLRREFSQLAALVSSDDFFEKLEINAKKNKLKGNVIKALVVRAERLRELFSKAKSLPELIIGYDKDCAQYTLAKMLCGSASDALVSSYIKSLTNLQQVIVSFKSAVVQLFLPVVRERLDVLKRSAGLYDYDDMIKHLLDAIQDSKRDALIGALRSRYRYALIDESQDTDERQWKIFEQVFVYSDSRNILYLVGDPKQAIYGFRGADVYT
jgi:exodeoxyribonuclease V beta subunit